MLFKTLLDFIYNIFLKKIYIKDIRTELKIASLKQEWGAKSISHLPIYPYLKLYIDGKKIEAETLIKKYYLYNLIDNGAIYKDKKDGGKKNGSAYMLIKEKHLEQGIILNYNLSNLNLKIVEEAIVERIKKRFAMIDSLKKYGYSPSCKLIHVIKKDNLFFIKDGHHRVAVLEILGYKTIPVVINNTKFITLFRRIFRIIHPKC